jgi:SAM-dependent methyltransferase
MKQERSRVANKEKAYQDYLKKMAFGTQGSIKRRLYEAVRKNPVLYKKYLKLTNWQVSKLSKIPGIANAERILDIGTGSGLTLSYVNEFINTSAELFGIDLKKNELLSDRIKFAECNIESEDIPFDKNSMDIVITTYVLEHLRDPYRLFEEANRVLKKNGYLYVVTEGYITTILPDYWNFWTDPTHIRPYTKRALKTLGEGTGFEIYKTGVIRTMEFVLLSPLFPILNLLSESNFSFMPFEIFGRSVYLIAKK